MKIGLDFDGVFCNAETLIRDGANKLFGVDLPENKVMEKDAIESGYLTQQEFNRLKTVVFGNASQDLAMNPVHGVDFACRTLIQRQHQLQIITKRSSGVEAVQNFCKMIGIQIPIIGMNPGQPKSSVAEGLDIFLDDSPNILDDLSDVVPSRFLFSWSYNQNSQPKNVKRVDSWLDFVLQVG
jgi:uncharacterized HAD superfamily protein